jgi:hypothetical protein
VMRKAQVLVQSALEQLGLTEEELCRVFENELAQSRRAPIGRDTMIDYIIETDQDTKSFRGEPALRGLDLRVPAEVFSASSTGWERPPRSRHSWACCDTIAAARASRCPMPTAPSGSADALASSPRTKNCIRI